MSISKYDCAALRELREAARAARVEEQLRDHAGEIHAAREYGVGALLAELVGIVARRHHLLSPLGELPFLEQPAADRGVIDAETLLLALDQRRLAPLLRTEARIDSGTA